MLFLLILVMLAGGVCALLAERVDARLPRWIALITIVIDAGFAATLGSTTLSPDALAALQGAPEPSAWLVVEQYAWVPRFGISLLLAVDGLGLLLLVLTLLLGAIAVLASWQEVTRRQGFFEANLLWTLGGVIGVFCALDLFAFFVFWEVMLVPMYFLIAIWGHEQRAYAAMKFFLFTQISGLLMLLAVVGLVWTHYAATGDWTFNYFALLGAAAGSPWAGWLMLGFLIAFLVKLPSVPFHSWLPDAHTQAPTAGSVLLAGILLKTGGYGLIRFVVPLFPDASVEFAFPAMLLGALSVVYGGVLAFAQDDFKRLVAYSSISHMGFVLLGVFAFNELALQGAIMQMVAHGLSTAALFMLAGALQHRLHTRDMSRMGGLWNQAPRMGVFALFFVVASLGMPGLGNFVGEFLVLLGAFQAQVALTVAAALGLVVAAIYALVLMQRAFYGPPGSAVLGMADFDGRETGTMAAMVLGLLVLGVHPQPVFDLTAPMVRVLLATLGGTP